MGDNYGVIIQDGIFNKSSWFIEKTESVIKLVLDQMELIESISSDTSENLKKKCEGELLDLCSIYCFLNNVEPDSELNRKLMIGKNRGNVLERLKVQYGLSERKADDSRKTFKSIRREIRKLLKSDDLRNINIIAGIISKNRDNLAPYKDQLKSIEECLENMQREYITWDIGKVIIGCILDSCKNI